MHEDSGDHSAHRIPQHWHSSISLRWWQMLPHRSAFFWNYNILKDIKKCILVYPGLLTPQHHYLLEPCELFWFHLNKLKCLFSHFPPLFFKTSGWGWGLWVLESFPLFALYPLFMLHTVTTHKMDIDFREISVKKLKTLWTHRSATFQLLDSEQAWTDLTGCYSNPWEI